MTNVCFNILNIYIYGTSFQKIKIYLLMFDYYNHIFVDIFGEN